MGIPRSIAAVLVVVAIIAIAKNVTVYKPSEATQAAATASQPDTQSAETIPPTPNNPHAFSIVPRNYNDPPPQLLAAARQMIARWKAWKAKPTAEVIPYSDWVNARGNLVKIKSSDGEFDEAKSLASQLDAFGIELANAEIKVADQIRAKEKAKEELARINDVGGRRSYAKLLENNFLRNSMDATVTIEGDKGSTLRVKYIGFTRPTMFKLQEEGKLIPEIIEAATTRGFRKLIMWNGYDLSWTWDLAKG
jgi:translation elongation factor EF-1beta